MAKKGDGIVRWFARCAREAKEQGLKGEAMRTYVGKCLLEQQVVKGEPKEATEEESK